MLEFTAPVEHWGRKFDRGMILYEFDALREPEKTRFPQIGAWVRERCQMVEVPTPSMLWRGAIVPDLYIANQLEAVKGKQNWLMGPASWVDYAPIPKIEWPDDWSLAKVSGYIHGEHFHDWFIEPMCRKITGLPSAQIVAKYHRSIWLPLYWPQTLRARASIRTPFYYPSAGFSGVLAEQIGKVDDVHGMDAASPSDAKSQSRGNFDVSTLGIAYVVAAPRKSFSVLFVVDDSPIYRITDMDACASLDPEFHRYVVEYRGECNVAQELDRLGLTYHPRHMAFDSVRLTLPTLENVRNGWRPRPTINDQISELMQRA